MKTCPNCHRIYSDMVTTCTACGTSLSSNAAPNQPQVSNPGTPEIQNWGNNINVPQNNNPAPQSNGTQDSGSALWVLPGIFIPLVGWGLYFAWRKNKPRNAKMANIGAWIGFVSGFLLQMI